MDKNIALMLREDMRSVQVVFGVVDPTKVDRQTLRLYTYVTNLALVPGSLVLVQAAEKLSVATVVQVDDDVDIPADSSIKYDLVVQKVDLTDYLETKRQLAELEKALQDEYIRRARLSAREALLMSLDDAGRTRIQGLLGGKS